MCTDFRIHFLSFPLYCVTQINQLNQTVMLARKWLNANVSQQVIKHII